MTLVAVAVFALTYLLVASRTWALLPIGRPGAALLGAVGMVAFGVLSPGEAWATLDGDTLLLLFGMMMLGGWLVEEGTVDGMERRLVRAAHGSPWRLMVLVCLASGLLSALLVNDTVCVFFTPVLLRVCQRARLPVAPYLLGLATSANLGSALTLVGNPQNMLIGSLSGLSFTRFALLSLPAVLVAGLAHLFILAWMYRGLLPARFEPFESEAKPARLLPPLVVGGVFLGLNLGLHMGWTALAGVMVLVLSRRSSPEPVFRRVDWTLLVFFAALFVVVGGLEHTGLVERAIELLKPYLSLSTWQGQLGFVVTVLIGSNLVSNVPLVMLLGPGMSELPQPELGWIELAFVSTVAGNLTLMGSVANLIVAEIARPVHEIGFREYLNLGLRTTLASLVLGVPTLILTHAVFGG